MFMHAKLQGSMLVKYALNNNDNPVNCLAYLPCISSMLFVTSAAGAVSVLSCPDAVVFAVCDFATHAAVLDNCIKFNKPCLAAYTHFSVEEDSLDISPDRFCIEFLAPAAAIAQHIKNDSNPVVVHCLMGMNRSCTALCLAAVMNDLPTAEQAANLVWYVQHVNKHVRCRVLTNYTFVKYILMFAAFVRQELFDDVFAEAFVQVLHNADKVCIELIARRFFHYSLTLTRTLPDD
jgi:protein tyrosine phosphatase